MREWAEFTLVENENGEERTLALSGPLRVFSIGDLDTELDEVDYEFAKLDLSGVTDIDTSGAWLALRFAQERGAQIVGTSEKARRLIAAIGNVQDGQHEIEPRPGLLARSAGEVGETVLGMRDGAIGSIAFLGAVLASFGSLMLHPSRFRIKSLIHHMQYIGVNSLIIIGLMSFLIGVVIAQQGAVQLAQFGAEIYTINLTGRLSLRELGILMTAIMVAGRSGSAFAAQIGTMKLTEEIDAMRTIGVSPIEALVIPRVLATMLMMPLLGFYASAMAIIGGAAISNFALDIPFWTFLERTQEVVPLTDVWIGLIKAPVFALIVAIAGCYQGMQVKSNAEEVGLRTTQSVVIAIFTVIVLDAFFAVFFTEIGWE